jgi:hypothetical protein
MNRHIHNVSRSLFAAVLLAACRQSFVVGLQLESESASFRMMSAVSHLEQRGHLAGAASDGVWLHSKGESSDASLPSRAMSGFSLHTFDHAEACVQLLRKVRDFYPTEPVYIMSDGGMNFTGLCAEIGNCNFQWRPPANDRWNPQPFFNRIREAASWLNTTYLVMLEPDNEIRGKIASEPTEDAGGLQDSNPPFGKPLLEYITKTGQKRTGNLNFNITWNRFGLAGGSYFRTTAVLDAFQPDKIDWKELRKWCGKKIWSSDVAMPMALASRGYTYKPWSEVTQTRSEDFWGKPKNFPAFRHYGRDEEKPYYQSSISKADSELVTKGPAWAGQVLCQGCVWVNDDKCWAQKVVRCPNGSQDEGPPMQ